jgi:hypothetical protein
MLQMTLFKESGFQGWVQMTGLTRGARDALPNFQGMKVVPSRKTQQSTVSLAPRSTKVSTEIRGILTKYWSFLHSKLFGNVQVRIILLLQLSACAKGGDDPNTP